MSRPRRLLVLLILTLVMLLLAALPAPLPQDQAYHRFADQRPWLGVPNFMDVASNLPFLLVGLCGLVFVWRRGRQVQRHEGVESTSFAHSSEAIPYALLFTALLMTALGSAYYHLAPDNGRLAWDRMPLSLVLVSYLSAVIAERIDRKSGLLLLLPLSILAVSSVIYWNLTEARGVGDLRLYLLVQAAPILLVAATVWMFAPTYTRSRDPIVVVAIYLLAKICEFLDAAIFELGQVVSGHTLKHCLAAMAVLWLLRMLRLRHPI